MKLLYRKLLFTVLNCHMMQITDRTSSTLPKGLVQCEYQCLQYCQNKADWIRNSLLQTVVSIKKTINNNNGIKFFLYISSL